jgi:hypothetical protein
MNSIDAKIILAIPALKFPPGQTVITSNAANRLTRAEIVDGLARHLSGDWGDLPPEDILLNEEALIHGNRLLSAYGKDDGRFWIITERDRSVTTILLPEDY